MDKKWEMIIFYPVEEVASLLLQRKERWGACALCSISRILATLFTQSVRVWSVLFTNTIPSSESPSWLKFYEG